ncbi:hypothetical protein BU25DRAFT_459261 [Macroventuria anomochaeta]|uniref:Uncharacterized protein n=1 Tax=Macroventuria anomochaeta TaxID=301207 RepID=A0ACB6RZH8_9PLEO|nr:uncharacterized protein BU25DRAFT_459261 [Macroventuria anomochaeta]KAF2626558.1 hypothetical protein BU25DRAFT_459261 [Macroventuria anomochaeta]
MTNLYFHVPGDVDWMDTDDSKAEADYTEHTDHTFDKASLKRKHWLVLTAVGLPQSDSEGRKRLRASSTARRDPFTHLLRIIRDLIYEYMTFPPSRMKTIEARVGRKRHYRFWVYVMKITDSHLSEIRHVIFYPQELAFKNDMAYVESLKHNNAAIVGRQQLMKPFMDTDGVTMSGHQHMKTFRIETTYEVGEDE